MNILVVYYSQFGNTKQVADAIAQTWSAVGSVREISADQLSASDINNVDLLVVGTPTHMANLPKALRSIFETLPKRILKDVRVAAFDRNVRTTCFSPPKRRWIPSANYDEGSSKSAKKDLSLWAD